MGGLGLSGKLCADCGKERLAMGATITVFPVMVKDKGIPAFRRHQTLNKLFRCAIIGDAEARQVDPFHRPCGECLQDSATTNAAEEPVDIG